ncbi:hypothetical protein LB505_000650 [Fusarium chuoi]|nr:hypothetical protein LB505_000650 [Fusarium chuoi]
MRLGRRREETSSLFMDWEGISEPLGSKREQPSRGLRSQNSLAVFKIRFASCHLATMLTVSAMSPIRE